MKLQAHELAAQVGAAMYAADRASMPMMVEPVPMAPNTAGYDVHQE